MGQHAGEFSALAVAVGGVVDRGLRIAESHLRGPEVLAEEDAFGQFIADSLHLADILRKPAPRLGIHRAVEMERRDHHRVAVADRVVDARVVVGLIEPDRFDQFRKDLALPQSCFRPTTCRRRRPKQPVPVGLERNREVGLNRPALAADAPTKPRRPFPRRLVRTHRDPRIEVHRLRDSTCRCECRRRPPRPGV